MTSHLGKQIASLVDGQLDHDDRDLALAHLASCSSCQSEVAELRRLKARLAALAAPTLPGSVADRLMRMPSAGLPAGSAAPTGSPAGTGATLPLTVELVMRHVRQRRRMSVSTLVPGPGDTFRSGRSADLSRVHGLAPVRPAARATVPTERVVLAMAMEPVRMTKPMRPSRSTSRPARPRAVPRTTTARADHRVPARPDAGVRGRHSRTRRTLMGSAAVFVFAVAGAALGGTRGPGVVPPPSTRPAVIPVVQPTLISELGVGSMQPVMAAVTLPTALRRG